ncbi:hypothetical protein BZA05DRAFT_407967 [Tricharina praecox]|uniref:uncharacterized protein n=1 Tax=Tricharina praecox TaxID=43433 RepID=UPI0022206996|nr:uncharacterized protein BZA05DRAFT_407967 [Tricharina praecox]KAI5845525.1 hypothetical protein BZA05DRAFT_407967 [Tricharina praecox]
MILASHCWRRCVLSVTIFARKVFWWMFLVVYLLFHYCYFIVAIHFCFTFLFYIFCVKISTFS